MSEGVETFRRAIGEPLRLVVAFGPLDYETMYVRDDVAVANSKSKHDSVYLELVSQNVGGKQFERTLTGGTHECLIHIFADQYAIIVPETRYRGWYVSVERKAAISLDTIVAASQTHLK